MPSKPIILLAAVLLAAAAICVLISDHQIRREFTQRHDRHAAVLAAKIPRLDAGTLEGAAVEITRLTGCKIMLDEKSLEAASIDLDAPVNLLLFYVTLDDAIKVMMEQVSGATKLDWRWEGDSIVISTANRIDEQAGLKIGLVDIRDFDQLTGISAEEEKAGETDGGLFGARSAYKDELIKLMMKRVSDPSFSEPFGSRYTFWEADNRVIFLQTSDGLDKIDQFMSQLRRPRHY